MKDSVEQKLESLVERFEEVLALLGEPSIINDQDKFRALSKEYSKLEEVVTQFRAF
ncbi:MAG: peptide chain release factor 1, partial [Glaciecola sp.]